jgi:hypothetical protein
MRWLSATILPKDILAILRRGPVSPAGVSQRLLAAGHAPAADVLGELETCETGLIEEEALRRLDERGPNVIASEHRTGRLRLLGTPCSIRWCSWQQSPFSPAIRVQER